VNYGRLLYDRVVRELSAFYEVVLPLERALADADADAVVPDRATDAYRYQGNLMRHSAVREAAGRLGVAVRLWRHRRSDVMCRASGQAWTAGQRLRGWHRLRRRFRAASTEAIERTDDVFVVSPFSGAERVTLLPLVNGLKARPGYSVVALESPDYPSPTRRSAPPVAGVPYRALDSFAAGADLVEARRVGGQIERLTRSLCDEGAQGPLGTAAATDYIRGRLPVVLGLQAMYAHLSLAAARRALATLRPRAVIVAKSRGPHMEALIESAREQSIPTAFLPHGLYRPDPSWRPVNADVVLSDGPAFEQLMASAGQPASTILRIGPPKYDGFLAMTTDERREAASQGGPLPPARPRVCLAATGDVAATVEMARALQGPLEEQGAALLIKLHPRLASPSIQSSFRRAAPSATLVLGGDSLTLYGACDLVVTGPSTAGVEAMVAGTPVVYVGGVDDDVHGYVKRQAAIHSPTAGDLPATVTRILTGAEPREALAAASTAYARATFDPLDGRATERAVAAIQDLIAREWRG
jgi:hypothetical protein